jgi:hypothetical protein
MKKYILYTKAQVNGWSYIKQKDMEHIHEWLINTHVGSKNKKYGHNIKKK